MAHCTHPGPRAANLHAGLSCAPGFAFRRALGWDQPRLTFPGVWTSGRSGFADWLPPEEGPWATAPWPRLQSHKRQDAPRPVSQACPGQIPGALPAGTEGFPSSTQLWSKRRPIHAPKIPWELIFPRGSVESDRVTGTVGTRPLAGRAGQTPVQVPGLGVRRSVCFTHVNSGPKV